ncbi:hypothetical protein PNOK_0479900 [Pyrrhoderma noxium]|uniref:Uncharacterized protein n=1 Tax=Pyrrhoderma noxium TaxID=2282107 RepID=A0A286UK69_9AGAM|nr:hypothetical protein PNOK_0479900 [Pyrrhoderma noxium]
MSYPYQYTDNLSSSAVPFESTSQQINSPWSVTSSGNFEDIQAQMDVTAALYSQDVLTQQQLHVGTSSLQTSAPNSDASATSPTQAQVYEPPRVIQLVERRPRRSQQHQQSSKRRTQGQHPGASMSKRNPESFNSPVPRPTQPDRQTQNQYSQVSLSAEPQTGWFNMLDVSRAKNHGLVQRPMSMISETRNSTHPYRRPSISGSGTTDTDKQKGKEVSNSPNEAQPSSSKSFVQSETEGVELKIPRYYLPGVKKSQIRLSMAMHPKTHVPLLIVCGYSRPLFPDGTHIPFNSNFWTAGYDQQEKRGFLVRERRSGAFVRKLVLASGTKLTDINQRRMEVGQHQHQHHHPTSDMRSVPAISLSY